MMLFYEIKNNDAGVCHKVCTVWKEFLYSLLGSFLTAVLESFLVKNQSLTLDRLMSSFPLTFHSMREINPSPFFVRAISRWTKLTSRSVWIFTFFLVFCYVIVVYNTKITLEISGCKTSSRHISNHITLSKMTDGQLPLESHWLAGSTGWAEMEVIPECHIPEINVS